MTPYQHALALAARGFHVFPLIEGAKLPLIEDFPNRATRDPATLAQWWNADMGEMFTLPYNVGIYTGRYGDDPDVSLCVIDVDNKNDKRGSDTILRMELEGFDFPATYTQDTPTGGHHLVYVTRTPVRNMVDRDGKGSIGRGLDIRGVGGFIVAAGSVTEKGAYTGNDLPVADAPRALIDCILAVGGAPIERQEPSAEMLAGLDPERVTERAIDYLRNRAPESIKGNGGDATAYKVAAHLKDIGVPEAEALDLLMEHWFDGCGWSPDRLSVKIANAYRYGKTAPGAAAPEMQFQPVTAGDANTSGEPCHGLAPTEIEVSEMFRQKYAKAALYCGQTSSWSLWDGRAWVLDETLRVPDMLRELCREVGLALRQKLRQEGYDEGRAQRAAANIESARFVYAVEKLARADRSFAAHIEQFDADPLQLNTPDGIVDLTTGKLRRHDPAAMCTRITSVGVGHHCPRWLWFIKCITCGDDELAGYLQRLAGYLLTGLTLEQVFVFLFGTGKNGKTTFADILALILGSYATVTSADMLTASNADRHPTELAALKGARLALANETEEGRRFAEAKVKSLTGGDAITARFMRQDFFTFKPQFKLMILGNHRPAIRNVDAAMRRRVHLVPFNFQATHPDRDLPAKLAAERDGILGWMLEGCLSWQRIGLQPPSSVTAATAEYFEAEDAIGRWLAEVADVGPHIGQVCSTSDLFASWSAWATRSGEFVGSMKRLSENLKQRQFEPAQDTRTRRFGFRGIKVRNDFAPGTPLRIASG